MKNQKFVVKKSKTTSTKLPGAIQSKPKRQTVKQSRKSVPPREDSIIRKKESTLSNQSFNKPHCDLPSGIKMICDNEGIYFEQTRTFSHTPVIKELIWTVS